MLDDQKWLEWYGRLQYDRLRRHMGLLRPDEGTMAPEDKIQLMLDRGEVPNEEPVDEDSIRKRMRLPRKETVNR